MTSPIRHRHAHLFSILKSVADEHHISMQKLLGRNRKREIAWPRQEAMLAAYREGYSYPEIGMMLGGRDHTTILHGCKAARKREREAIAQRPTFSPANSFVGHMKMTAI